jgi:hypothetical protein
MAEGLGNVADQGCDGGGELPERADDGAGECLQPCDEAAQQRRDQTPSRGDTVANGDHQPDQGSSGSAESGDDHSTDPGRGGSKPTSRRGETVQQRTAQLPGRNQRHEGHSQDPPEASELPGHHLASRPLSPARHGMHVRRVGGV